MKMTLRHTMLILSLATLLISCSDDGPYSSVAELSDIVTYEGSSASGAVFTLQQQGDSPMVTLVAKDSYINETRYAQGCRMLISYYPENNEAYTSGNITLTATTAINQGEMQIGDMEEIGDWDADAIYLNSIWRTGNYINIYMRVDYSTKARRFKLIMDEATSSDLIPQLYLVHDMLGQPDSFTRRAYASFDISQVWNNADCQGVTIHVNDSNLETDTYTFKKQE